MMSKILSKLLLICIISCFLSGQAFAVYKHKVIVTEFDDPQGWKESYSPGEILSNNLKWKLIQNGQFHMLPEKMNVNSMPGKMSGPSMMNLSPGEMKEKEMMNEGLQEKMQMRKPVRKPKPLKIEKSQFSSKEYEKHSKKRNNPSSFRSEGSHANYQYQADVEPAIHYISSDSLIDVIQIQGPSGAMMGSEGMMKDSGMMDSKNTMMHDPIPWPIRLGSMANKASLFEIRGQVIKFDPGNMNIATMDNGKTNTTEKAELEVMLQLVQNKTGRVIYKQKFRAFSNSGRRPFSKELDMSLDGGDGLESSSMSLALSFLTREMLSFVNNTISRDPLEGEIIAIKNEDVLINIGRQNGVRVGDRFRVHSVGLQLDDPLTEYDLGDIYVKMGVIQVLESMLGFSKARIIVGKDFMPGNLVRSFKQFKGFNQQFSAGEALSESEEPVPWWSFHDIKSVP
jgi:hypothetical protein